MMHHLVGGHYVEFPVLKQQLGAVKRHKSCICQSLTGRFGQLDLFWIDVNASHLSVKGPGNVDGGRPIPAADVEIALPWFNTDGA